MKQEQRRRQHAERLRAIGQSHVLSFWDRLDESERAALLDDLDLVPYDLLAEVDRTGLEALAPPIPDINRLEPVPTTDRWALGSQVQQVRAAGEEALRDGRVAALTVAGGQGTRLGYDGPKGSFPIGPLSGHSFFQIIAEAVHGASRRYGVQIPWYVMTSEATHAATKKYFENNGNLELQPGQVRLFRQGSLPALSDDGRIVLAERHRLALSPNGHGGLIEALNRGGHLENMRNEGIRYVSTFQVDNPLVHWFDPIFIGLHVTRSADVSCKAIAKRSDSEGLGNFCTLDGRTHCIEYSDFPATHASAKKEDGSRKFDAGGISIYLMNVDFLAQLTGKDNVLPIHPARKKVPFVSLQSGLHEIPSGPNATKMERFVFDILPKANEVLIVKTRRDEEFGPVKNRQGADSVESCREALIQRACRWLAQAGVHIPTRNDGTFDAIVEISPRVAQSPEELATLSALPRSLQSGQRLFLEDKVHPKTHK